MQESTEATFGGTPRGAQDGEPSSAEDSRVTYVITNNHYRGQAPANALQLIEILTGRRPAVPSALQREFPFLTSDPGPPGRSVTT